MTHELNNNLSGENNARTPTPVWQGLGERETPPKGSVQYEEVLAATGKTVLEDDFDYTDYLASTGQIVFSEDDPRAQKYADNENYQAAANSQVAQAFLQVQAERDFAPKVRKVDPLPWDIDPRNPDNIEKISPEKIPSPVPIPPEQIWPIFPDQPVPFEDFDPNGNIIEPIYLEKPPEIKPIAGTQDYELLLIETDGAAAEPEFDYKAHIAATRQPKDYPDWIDPVEDIDPRWVDPDKIGVVKTFEKDFDDYQFYKREDGSIEIKTDDGFDDITGIPKLEFADDTKISAIAHIEATFDQVTGKEDHTGQMFRLYNAAFARFPDADGLEYWIDKNGSGENSKREVAQSFIASEEFSDKYGDNVSTEDYVKTLYNNILGRTPDPEGYDYWVGQLSSGNETRAEALLGFAESAENKALFSDMTGLV